MKLNDHIASVLRECQLLLKLCPSDEPASVAVQMEASAARLASTAAWLRGQATMMSSPDCSCCGGRGWVREGDRCNDCDGTGKVPHEPTV